MWCKRFGRTCILVFDKVSGRPRFIRERVWFNMSDKEIERFVW